MFNLPWNEEWFRWSATIAVAFPLLAVLLSELTYRAKRRRWPTADILRNIRNFVLPTGAVLLMLTHVLQVPVEGTVWRLVATLFWLSVIHAGLSLLNVMLFSRASRHSWRSRVPSLFIDLVRTFLILIGGAFVLSAVWGTNLAGLVTALGIGSIVLGLALQDTLGNLFAGISLVFERPFRIGDWLEVGEHSGRVIEVNWRSVQLQTRELSMIVLPNSLLGKESFENFSRPTRQHLEKITIGFSYNDAPNHVKQVMLETATATAGVRKDPPPEVFTLSYDDSSISYEVRLYVSDYTDVNIIRDEFITRIWYAARRHDLNIPFPIRTVHRFKGDPATQKEQAVQLRGIQMVPTFMSMGPGDFDDLGHGLALERFAQGEVVSREGDFGKSIFIILSGEANVSTRDKRGVDQPVMSIGRGDFFGMSLLTGEPSSTTVTATTDLDVVQIESSVAHKLLERNPRLSHEMAQIIDARQKAVGVIRASQETARAGAAVARS